MFVSLPHPFWRNSSWLKRNPWLDEIVRQREPAKCVDPNWGVGGSLGQSMYGQKPGADA